jgi:hypothetical protein
MSRSVTIAILILLSLGAQACAQPQAAPPSSSASASTTSASPPPPPPPAPAPAPSAPHPSPDRAHVYRLDFVLTSKEGPAAATTSFSLTLEEGRHGEVLVGKNVPISSAAPPAAGGNAPAPASARQDVGLKVKAQYRATNDDLLFDIVTEMSTYDPPSTIRKVFVTGSVLAATGKPTLVMNLDDDRKHYELDVTPTKIR